MTRYCLTKILYLLTLGGIIKISHSQCTHPNVTIESTAVNPSTGSSLTFTCSSTGGQTSFQWYKNGMSIMTGISSYTLSSIKAEDGGVYICGTECNDMIINSDPLVITTEPTIVNLTGPSSVIEGDMLNLSCLAMGWPTPTITWLLNGAPILNGITTYIVRSITPAQEGLYQCRASNSRGVDIRNHTVSVMGGLDSSTAVPSTVTGTLSAQNDNMDSTATAAFSQPDEVPFIVALVVSCVLVVGIIILLFIMGCLCCSEFRRAKTRRLSDEIALLPATNGVQDNNGEAGYGNLDASRPSGINLGLREGTGPSTDHTATKPAREGRPSPRGVKKRKLKSRSPDKEQLISLDSQDEENRAPSQPTSAASPGEIAPSLPTSNTPSPTHKPLTPTEGVGSPVEPGIKKISGDETSLEDKKEWESFPVVDDVPASSPRTSLTERAKKLGRTVSFVELLTRSNPLDAQQIDDLVYNPEHYAGVHPLMQEYKSIPTNSAKLIDLLPTEKIKNRYRNVLPNAHSRVPLADIGQPGSTYINANYIRGYADQEKAYIATQGPIYETMGDFWRMVWEQEVSVVVMITGIIERGTTVYGLVAVKNNYEEKTPIGVISYLTLFDQDGHEKDLYHFWYNTWPDFVVPKYAQAFFQGVPKETGFILALRKTVEQYRGASDKPLLVHCSAGLGRTGTYIAIDMGMRQFEAEKRVDPLKYICEMRQDRGGIIQTPEQYLFVHNALADYMHSE